MSIHLNHQNAALRVCVDRLCDGKISGRIVSRRLKTPIVFSDLNDMIEQAELLFDVQAFPQAFQRIRSFTAETAKNSAAALDDAEMTPPEVVDAARGECATFVLRVTTRQEATWQGTVDWLDGTAPEKFNDMLALFKSIDQHLFNKN